MANDVGYIRQDDMPSLEIWLNRKGVAFAKGVGLWEVIRIYYGGHTNVVTRNKVEQYKTPVELRPLLLEFREFLNNYVPEPEPAPGITDTERLDFMLRKSRQVIVEIEGWGSEGRHYAIYVTEGTMSDHEYPAVRFTQAEDFSGVSEEGFKIKREAIDLAIFENRNQVSEKSN